jgi:FkbM family methyltransferase
MRPAVRPLCKAGVVRDSVWKRLPVEETFSVSVGGQCFRYASCYGDDLGRSLYWRGITGYESETIEAFCSFLTDARVVLDVGAYTGLYSLLSLSLNSNCEVVAFEPAPAVRERAFLNIRINNWIDRCEIRQQCVSDSCGPRKFHVPSAGSALVASSSLNPNGFHNLPGRLIDVQCTSLDAAIPVGKRVDLVKIDVEGFEGAVLRGMQRILTESGPTIIFECTDETSGDAEEVLVRNRYSLYHIGPGGPVPVDHILPDSEFRNYLAKPPGIA